MMIIYMIVTMMIYNDKIMASKSNFDDNDNTQQAKYGFINPVWT